MCIFPLDAPRSRLVCANRTAQSWGQSKPHECRYLRAEAAQDSYRLREIAKTAQALCGSVCCWGIWCRCIAQHRVPGATPERSCSQVVEKTADSRSHRRGNSASRRADRRASGDCAATDARHCLSRSTQARGRERPNDSLAQAGCADSGSHCVSRYRGSLERGLHGHSVQIQALGQGEGE